MYNPLRPSEPKKNFRVQCAALASLALLVFAIGCNSPKESQLAIGSKPLSFDPKKIREITLSKSDPTTTDHWIATLQQEKGYWKISSGPEDQAILDRQADETFIFHLLDVIQNIKISGMAPRGNQDSYGLEPPRFSVRMQTTDHSWEFYVGVPAGSSVPGQKGNYFFSLDGKAVYLARGSAFQMLHLIDSFQFLRRRTWTNIAPDDIDEVEINRRGQKPFYAQREGDRWTNRLHKEVRANLEGFLQETLLGRVEAFIDNPALSQSLAKRIQDHPSYETRLTHRKGQVTCIKVRQEGKNLYGMTSSRPASVFILNPNLAEIFEKSLVPHLQPASLSGDLHHPTS